MGGTTTFLLQFLLSQTNKSAFTYSVEIHICANSNGVNTIQYIVTLLVTHCISNKQNQTSLTIVSMIKTFYSS